MLALPCCRHCGSVNWGGAEGGCVEGASATGSEEPPLASYLPAPLPLYIGQQTLKDECPLYVFFTLLGSSGRGGGVGLGWVKASSGPPGPQTSPFPARHNWSGGFTVVRSQGLPD